MKNQSFLAGRTGCVGPWVIVAGSCVNILKSLYEIDVVLFLNIWKNSLGNRSGVSPLGRFINYTPTDVGCSDFVFSCVSFHMFSFFQNFSLLNRQMY